MNQHRHSQRSTHTHLASGALALLLIGLTSCAGPIRHGDVDWTVFERMGNDGLSADAALAAEKREMERQGKDLARTVNDDERFLAGGPERFTGDIAERYRHMQRIKGQVAEDREVLLTANRMVRNLDEQRAESWIRYRRALRVFLDDAWQTTREGAFNFRANFSLGASTDSQLDLTGTHTDHDGTTVAFTGILTGDGISTDSSEFGVEYYIREGLAVEAGTIFSNVVRDDEAIDTEILEYNDEGHAGVYLGLKYCMAAVQSDGTGLASGRMRPFVNLRLGFMESYDLSGGVAIPGSDPLEMQMSGEAYTTFGIGGGVLYAWTDHIGLELGVNHIRSFSEIEGTWSFTGAGGDDYRGDFSTDISTTRVYFGVVFGF